MKFILKYQIFDKSFKGYTQQTSENNLGIARDPSIIIIRCSHKYQKHQEMPIIIAFRVVHIGNNEIPAVFFAMGKILEKSLGRTGYSNPVRGRQFQLDF